jgi:hypothetical protein
MFAKNYDLSDIHSGGCPQEHRVKYMNLIEHHQRFMVELAQEHSFIDYLSENNVDTDLVSFISSAEEYGVVIVPSKSSLKWNPPSGYVNFL